MHDQIPELPDTDPACFDTNYALHASPPGSAVHVNQHSRQHFLKKFNIQKHDDDDVYYNCDSFESRLHVCLPCDALKSV